MLDTHGGCAHTDLPEVGRDITWGGYVVECGTVAGTKAIGTAPERLWGGGEWKEILFESGRAWSHFTAGFQEE